MEQLSTGKVTALLGYILFCSTKIYYKNFTGGVLSLRTWAMKRINGFTNIMFGWGGEDDNASARFVELKVWLWLLIPN